MLRKLKIVIFGILFIVIGILTYEVVRRRIGGLVGSYPYAESWVVNNSFDDLKIALEKFHQDDPSLFINPDSLIFSNDPTGYWTKVDFFYQNRNEIVHALIRKQNNKSNISLIYFENTQNSSIRVMNKDFNFFENRKEIKLFEERILEKMRNKYNTMYERKISF